MSADNWAVCPRCRRAKQADIDKRQAAIHAMYGEVPVEDFDEARRQFEAEDWSVPETFREDWEIGLTDGVFFVSYRGRCSDCNLRYEFKTDHTIDLDGAS